MVRSRGNHRSLVKTTQRIAAMLQVLGGDVFIVRALADNCAFLVRSRSAVVSRGFVNCA